MQDDFELLAGVRKLDPQAITKTHEKYYPVLYRYVFFRVGDHPTAEDITAEVFTRLLTAIRDKNAPQNTLRGWLYSVASRVIADHHRRRYRYDKYESKIDLGEAPVDPAVAVAKEQSNQELYAALKKLTDEQQDVISLRFGFGLSIRDVANTLNKSEGAVKQLQARAVARLSTMLKAESIT